MQAKIIKYIIKIHTEFLRDFTWTLVRCYELCKMIIKRNFKIEIFQKHGVRLALSFINPGWKQSTSSAVSDFQTHPTNTLLLANILWELPGKFFALVRSKYYQTRENLKFKDMRKSKIESLPKISSEANLLAAGVLLRFKRNQSQVSYMTSN